MSATDEDVAAFFGRSAPLASRLIGSVSGAAVGLAIAGPPGAMIGSLVAPFVTDSLEKLTGEIISRQLGSRQYIRAGAGFTLLELALKEHLSRGEKVREDEFSTADESGRRPIDEVTEQAILAMINAVDERRIPYLANFYAALYFDETISRTSIPTLSAIADGLNYRAMCILNLVGRGILYTGAERVKGTPAPWPKNDYIVSKEAFSLASASLLVSKYAGNDHYTAITGYDDIEPASFVLSPIGEILFAKMGIANMLNIDYALHETEQSLRRISACPYGDWIVDPLKLIEETLNEGL